MISTRSRKAWTAARIKIRRVDKNLWGPLEMKQRPRIYTLSESVLSIVALPLLVENQQTQLTRSVEELRLIGLGRQERTGPRLNGGQQRQRLELGGNTIKTLS